MQSTNDMILQKLRKMYGYDMAIIKQSGQVLSQQDELESMALHHLDKQIVAAVQEFMVSIGNADNMDAAAIAVLMGFCGVLLADIKSKKGVSASNSALRFGKQYLTSRYEQIINQKE